MAESFLDWLAGAYLWLKAFHIMAVISWMAGLLYLPRLFVYHCSAEPGSIQAETFKVMERRLLRGIMLPSMIVSVVLGAMLLATPGVAGLGQGWVHAKLSLVALLLVIHHLLGRHRRAFAEDRNKHSERYFRILNEVPAVLMVGIVIFVVVKPF